VVKATAQTLQFQSDGGEDGGSWVQTTVVAHTYAYDALGRQISDTTTNASGLVTAVNRMFYNGQNVIEERNGLSGNVTNQYVWSAAGPNTMILRDSETSAGGSSSAIPQISGAPLNQRLYAQDNGQGSITSITDAWGNVVERYLYDQDGQPTAITAGWATWNDGSTTLQPTDSRYSWVYLYEGQRYTEFLSTMTGGSFIQDGGLYTSGAGSSWYDPFHGTNVQPNFSGYGTVSPYDPTNGETGWDKWYGQNAGTIAAVSGGLLGVAVSVLTGGLAAPLAGGLAGTIGVGALAGATGGFVTGAAQGYGATGTLSGTLGQGGIGAIAGGVGGAVGGGVFVGGGFCPAQISGYIASGAAGGAAGGAVAGGIQGYQSGGWSGAGAGALQGGLIGGLTGAAGGAIAYGGMAALGILPAGACFTAGTLALDSYGRKRIETLDVCQRLLTEGTEANAEQFGDDPTEIDVANSRLVTLRMPNSQCPSDVIEMKLVRPVGLLRDAGWEAGAVRPMKIAELGIEGLATIVSVEPCSAIQPGRGRVITGTITHLNGQLLQLKLRGLDEPIEVTEPHRFYSEDRLDWVAAKELRVGERLRRRGGAVAVVEAVTKLPGVYRVYNVEVEGEQQYFVSGLDVLVHNICSQTVADAEAYATAQQAEFASQPVEGPIEEVPGEYGTWDEGELAVDTEAELGLHTISQSARNEAAEFGTKVHQNFQQALMEQTGTNARDWRMQTAPGQTGVDATYIGPDERNPGFDFAELKPANSASAMSDFQAQMNSWGLPEGRTQLWLYSKSGAIGSSGTNF
jgi:YD repeat-containing protein